MLRSYVPVMTSSEVSPLPVGFSLGSNQGDRIELLRDALDALHAARGITLHHASRFYETAPWGVEDQPPFINLCAIGETTLEPLQLLEATQSVERKLGRVKTIRWGPRFIDIDILFLGSMEFSSEKLTIPHKHMLERSFVLIPLAELDSDLVVKKTRISDAVKQLKIAPQDFSATNDRKWCAYAPKSTN